MQLFYKVSSYLQKYDMLSEGGGVLAAVSGGADSMCMLHVLWELSRSRGFALWAATFDHQIRPEGASDADFVADWCQKHHIPCIKGTENVPKYAKLHHLGLEESARILRYEFLRKTAAETGMKFIATAHNANDNAETVLLHLLRGSGLNGLGGIRPVMGEIIRPILCCERQEIIAYLTEKGIPYVEDATNADTAYSRNYIRHEVLPLLREKNPALLENLLRSGEGLRRDEAYLQSQTEKTTKTAEKHPDRVIFSAKEYAELPEALFSRAIESLFEELSAGLVLSSRHREGVRGLCRSTDPSASAALPGGIVARREYDRVVLEKRKEGCIPEEVFLRPGERVRFGDRILTCSWAVCPGGKFNQRWEYYLKAGEAPLLLRTRRVGDEITLPARSRKTVKKLLIDSKIPKEERSRVAVLESEGKVAALDGFGADTAFLPCVNENCWKISSEKIKNDQ